LFFELSALGSSSSYHAISLSDGTQNNEALFYYQTSGNVIAYQYGVAGSVVSNLIFSGYDITENSLFAITWKLNEFKFFKDGVKIAEDLSGAVASSNTFTKLSLSRGDNSMPLNANLKQLKLYNTALTEAELEYMTSYRSLNEMVTELNLNEL
jgi:prophage tail gpP-like protein